MRARGVGTLALAGPEWSRKATPGPDASWAILGPFLGILRRADPHHCLDETRGASPIDAVHCEFAFQALEELSGVRADVARHHLRGVRIQTPGEEAMIEPPRPGGATGA
uniref:Uncharacterized protein n=1 Tax=viral metagenome TaxID=1070528 RepID=A0A6M3IJU7_9ZZZZ